MKNSIEIYDNGSVELEIPFDGETIWLRQNEIAQLFAKDRTVVTRHINNILKDDEVEQKSNVQKMHIANSVQPVAFYSLDIILAVGYITNSSQAIKFRKWATKILKEHLKKGYSINQKQFQQKQLNELISTIELIKNSLQNKTIENDEAKAGNLLYYIIKDHPFSDGNKRIGSFLFILFLSRNNLLYKPNGELRINDNALVSLALLIASSDPKQKELMVKLVVNLLGD